MRIKKLIMVILFLLATLAQGCGVTASVSAPALTQPVMLGKKIRVQGTANEQWQLRIPIDISITNRIFLGTGGYQYAWSKANPELLKLVETSKDRIVIDEVYIGSYSIFLFVPFSFVEEEKSWTDIKGGIYHEKADAHEPK
jgi:hypothetical protein